MNCPFCDYADRTLVVYEDARTFVVPSRHQRAGRLGHCIVAPRTHVETLYTLDDASAAALFPVVRDAAIAVKQAFGADGVAIRQNNEAAAGQDVAHLHVHVIPRFAGVVEAPYAIVDEDVRRAQARALCAAWPARRREDRE